jgi:hypothetical protein
MVVRLGSDSFVAGVERRLRRSLRRNPLIAYLRPRWESVSGDLTRVHFSFFLDCS